MAVLAAYVTVIVVWSTTSLGIVLSNDSLTFSAAILARMVLGALVLTVVMWLKRMRLPLSMPALCSYAAGALSVCGGKLLTYWAAQWFPSGLMAVVWGAMPMAMALVARFMIGERLPNALQLLAMLAAMTGLGVIFLDQGNDTTVGLPVIPLIAWVGMAAAILAFAFSATGVKRIAAPVNALQQTNGTLLLSSALLLLFWAINDGELPTNVSDKSFYAVIYLGIVGSALGFLAYYYILERLAAIQVSLIPVITPVFALLLGVYFNNEQIGVLSLVGSAVVILALAGFQYENVRRDRKARRAEQQAATSEVHAT